MEFNETITTINNYLKDGGNKLQKKQEKNLKDCLEIIIGHMKDLDEDRTPIFFSKNSLKNGLITLCDVSINSPMTEELVGFLDAYTQLYYNWNNNVCNDDEIRVISQLLGNIVLSHRSIVRSISVLREVNSKIVDYRNWDPPFYDISKKYLESLM